MLYPITDPNEIAKWHSQLQKRLLKESSENIQTVLGYPGGSQTLSVQYSEKYNIWWSLEKIYSSSQGNKRWNAFGIGKPKVGRNTNIICEINYLESGFSRSLGGSLAEDLSGNVFLMHNGEIGGGRAGVGKSLFQTNYREDAWQEVFFEGRVKHFVPVGQIDHERLIQQLAYFVHEVARIKALSRQGQAPAESLETHPQTGGQLQHTFNDEFSGEKRYQISREVVASADHGLVVSALRAQLDILEHQSANTQKVDLYIHQERPLAIFEVKTNLSTQAVYTAIGQLMLHSLSVGGNVKRYFVAPFNISPVLVEDLRSLNIQTLTFHWEHGAPVFDNLHIIDINA